MKFSKQAILARVHKIPSIRFEDQQLTSFGGAIVFQMLFQRLNLKARLKQCFRPVKGSAVFGPHRIVLLLIVHLLLGFRRLRDVDYYRDDPVVQRLLGLRRLPDVATISRTLAAMGRDSVEKVRALCSALVIDALRRECFSRLTLDFDGSVTSTRGHVEGTAVGYNSKKKGARSYYNLNCTVAQTGQFLDVLPRPGNVHDSRGAHEFMMDTFDRVRGSLPTTVLESRMDSAFFSQKTLTLMDLYGVECSVSVPFERFLVLKQMIESRRRWRYLDGDRSYFESDWQAKSWPASYRFLFVRRKVHLQVKEALQLDLFQPRETDYDYRVVVTNKTGSARSVPPLPLRSRLTGRGVCRGQAACRSRSDSHPPVARQPHGHLVCDDGTQSGTRNADARPSALELFPRQTPRCVGLSDTGHAATPFHHARRPSYAAAG